MANSQLLEIVLLAMIAVVILFRLYAVLGRRTGSEPPPQEPFRLSGPVEKTAPSDNVIPLPQMAGPRAEQQAEPVASGLSAIRQADRDFDLDHFAAGAKQAYETILVAFAANDRATLKPLLSEEVFSAFDSVMRGREERKQKTSFTFVGFKDCKLVHAELKGRLAEITLALTAQYISATADGNGTIVEGDPKTVHEVTDVWTFERNVRASDPNWTLVATSGGEHGA